MQLKKEETMSVSASNGSGDSRREFVRKAVYVAPAILTLTARPAVANTGSRDQYSFHYEPTAYAGDEHRSLLQWFVSLFFPGV